MFLLDVVFLGASEVYTGIAAGRAYDKYGFTSYPFASESITADGTMLALKEILRTQDPQMIMIEINPYLYGFDTNESHEAHIRKLVDNIPLNMNKIELGLNGLNKFFDLFEMKPRKIYNNGFFGGFLPMRLLL